MQNPQDNFSIKPEQIKSSHALREENTLAFWKKEGIFEKTLIKNEGGKEFVFYEGPPTANGHPGIHHLEARAFKDAIPRYKTMRGYFVRRKGGWDTHGLPVELQVEKQLGLKSKKEIEKFGIAEFNNKCKESVWVYVHEWEEFTDRIGYWIDLKDPYITYKPKYIESIWNIIKKVDEQNLLYKDYKVVPWCPRCGTALSSHELAQGYDTVKDLSVTVKFKVSDSKLAKNIFPESAIIYLLAWTTTPWTLPGNVALAIGEEIEYILIKMLDSGEYLILAKERSKILKEAKFEILKTFKGRDLIGLQYEQLYPFISQNITGSEKKKLDNAYKVYSAQFVNTDDGTGIVHTAVMYGQDDFELGTRVGLPKFHLVNEDGTFKKEVGFLGGAFVKDPETDIAIVKDLAHRGLLFAKEKYEHTYPFCWRCHTALIYFARDSWYIRMSTLREKLVKENEDINWEPSHIKEGRFGEWLREVKDWAISRERYWGTPLPIWHCEQCKKIFVAGSIEDVSLPLRNNYYLMRHGQSENNLDGTLNSDMKKIYNLTKKGKEEVISSAKLNNIKPDIIICSPFERTKQTALTFADTVGLSKEAIIFDDRLGEMHFGQMDGQIRDGYQLLFPSGKNDVLSDKGIENSIDIKKRVMRLIDDLEKKHEGKEIILISHDGPLWMLESAIRGLDSEETSVLKRNNEPFMNNGEIKPFNFKKIPLNSDYELDLHKPFIDNVQFNCSCGGKMLRVKEVMDVWFDSGSMPFAQDHYPFESKKGIFSKQKVSYPADFISEAIDQTRGWFYTLHAIGTLIGKGKAYKNVICLGHILDGQGKKMSKSLGNIVNPFEMMNKYGADSLRFWMYSVNQPGDSKNFEEKTVDEVVKKVFNMITNVLAFYKLYENKSVENVQSSNILDIWINARLNQLIRAVTDGLDNYKFFEPTRAIREFVGDLSQWYLQSSRDRFKTEGDEKVQALATLRHTLLTLSKIMAPLTPFLAEHVYKEIGGEKESVHLEDWPKFEKFDDKIIEDMDTTRKIVEVALALRSHKKIGIRQPLSRLDYEIVADRKSISKDFENLISEKLNVKSVIERKMDISPLSSVLEKGDQIYFESAGIRASLDIKITPALKEEGEVRELLRKIQDLRKERGLKVGELAELTITQDMKELVSKNEEMIKKATNLKDIDLGEVFELRM